MEHSKGIPLHEYTRIVKGLFQQVRFLKVPRGDSECFALHLKF
nr:MAG TPA: hypothetical protein [Caudoviricetes sp.]